MSKPSARLIHRYLHHSHHLPSNPSSHHHPNPSYLTPSRTHFSSSTPRTLNPPNQFDPLSNLLLNRGFLGFRRFSFKSCELGSENIARIFQNSPNQFNPQSNFLLNIRFLGFRRFSFKSFELGSEVSGNFVKNAVKRPAMAVREAVGLQVEAFWKRNNLVLVGAGGVMVCILPWRVMFGIANTFVGLSEGMAKYGFLALSSAIVAFARYLDHPPIDVDEENETDFNILSWWKQQEPRAEIFCSFHHDTDIKINRTRDIFGYPVLRMKVSRGRNIYRLEDQRYCYCHLAFGSFHCLQYDMRLLAVDVPTATGPDQRIFLTGDEEEYRVGGGLISELRDPVVKAMAATKEFEDRDEREDEEDAERELQEAERRHREEIEKLEKGS
ncbi:uncharacterized protein LOC130775262 [Actinidia eriantha]|uniref:uncharacterized protein LOC130775262 n=1 Tax=Actinidia eriantha TaxID=165200 RepID=UPI0025907E48|nr:uncharacterized protein LOC130775262 [Actinidia eriantha]